MKIAILGGGFTGLTAAYRLATKGHTVTLFEKAHELGGLAVGIRGEGWEWHLERAIHHIFSNDTAIIGLAREIGFKNILFRAPLSASLYEDNNNYRIIPVDTPQDFLRFPYLSLMDKFRAGATLAALKLSPFLPLYESLTAEEFLKLTMGKKTWNVLWQELFRKKFGKYAGNILASFIWARIKKRTKRLGYFEGGFQSLIRQLEVVCLESQVAIKKGCQVVSVAKTRGAFMIAYKPAEGERVRGKYDRVISTLPTPILTRVTPDLFPSSYRARLQKIEYLHAVSLILETKESYLKRAYWSNISTKKVPMMLLAQHTNFMDKRHYANHHIAYVGWYVERADKLINMGEAEVYRLVEPSLAAIAGRPVRVYKTYLFKGPFAQPIFSREFLRNKPEFETPVKGFFIANLDMTYPYDRGTNYAVDLGNQVASYV